MAKSNRNREIGQKGEKIALEFLKNIGYRLEVSNWRYNRAEIDLIMWDEEVLVFVEVKTRSSVYFGSPEESIDDYKEALIFSAAQKYMEAIGHDWEIRFDIISIVLHDVLAFKNYDVKHLKDVFY